MVIPERTEAGSFYPFLNLLNEQDSKERVELDFSRLRKVSPAALVVLAGAVDRWRNAGKEVCFIGYEECRIVRYLQRMNFFRLCGIDLPEAFERHASAGRFVPLEKIGYEVDALSGEVAACLAPGGEDGDHELADLYDFIQYVISEAATNVRQHSRGNGFVAAQVKNADGLVRLAIADNGIGIRISFQEADFGWARETSDLEAVKRALQSGISSKGGPVNQGVGLTMLTELAQLMDGWYGIISGSGYGSGKPQRETVFGEMPSGASLRGTLVVLAFRSDKVSYYPDLLTKAKISAGLLPPDFMGGKFLV